MPFFFKVANLIDIFYSTKLIIFKDLVVLNIFTELGRYE